MKEDMSKYHTKIEAGYTQSPRSRPIIVHPRKGTTRIDLILLVAVILLIFVLIGLN